MRGIEVRIRHVGDSQGAVLCEAPYNELEDVLQQVKEWGLRFGERGTMGTGFTGEMVAEGGRVFFEILVETAGDE